MTASEPSTHDDRLWPDAYEHCVLCDALKIKADMVQYLDEGEVCTLCAAKCIASAHTIMQIAHMVVDNPSSHNLDVLHDVLIDFYAR